MRCKQKIPAFYRLVACERSYWFECNGECKHVDKNLNCMYQWWWEIKLFANNRRICISRSSKNRIFDFQFPAQTLPWAVEHKIWCRVDLECRSCILPPCSKTTYHRLADKATKIFEWFLIVWRLWNIGIKIAASHTKWLAAISPFSSGVTPQGLSQSVILGFISRCPYEE